MAIHEAGWTVQGAQLGKEESWGCKEQVCSLRVCTEGLVAQGPLPGRNLYPAWLSIELDIARQPLLSSSYQRLLYPLPRDRHGQPLGKDSPRKRLHVPHSRKLQPQQVGVATWPRWVLSREGNLAEGPCHFRRPQGNREKMAGPSYISWFNDMEHIASFLSLI